MDEKTQIQALDRTAPILPLRPDPCLKGVFIAVGWLTWGFAMARIWA
ncbi:hypothetical protein [Streptomyces sp. NPDC005970]